MNFLFWNLRSKRLLDAVRALAVEHDTDVIVLAECEIPPDRMLRGLNLEEFQYHLVEIRIPEPTIAIYARLPRSFVIPLADDLGITVHSVSVPGLDAFLLVSLHLPSKLHRDEASQLAHAIRVATLIRDSEREAGHRRTIVVGDFNMNPFEAGMIAANGFHAVMTRDRALKVQRTVAAKTFPFFYNPMWSLLGDLSPGPPGTYHHAQAVEVCQFWHMFDQVLVRPELIPALAPETVRIIDEFEENTLTTESGIPAKSAFSDHFPIAFTVNL